MDYFIMLEGPMKTLLKSFLVVIMAAAVCLFWATAASALSLQARGGVVGGDDGSGTNVGLDVFFYEGKSFDFFVGYDLISSSKTFDLSFAGGPSSATTDVDTTALTLGLRYKMQTESSFKPFLSLGLARYHTKFTQQAGLESYYEQPFEEDSTGLRFGLGADIGISDNWSIGLEAVLLTNVYYYEEGLFSGMPRLDRAGVVSQLDLGLRYHIF